MKKYANKYQYSPNPYASTLASGKVKTVGYVLPIYGINTSMLNQGNFFQFISGMSDELLAESIQLQILFAKSEDEEIRAYEKLILEQKIENIVLQNIKTNDIEIENGDRIAQMICTIYRSTDTSRDAARQKNAPAHAHKRCTHRRAAPSIHRTRRGPMALGLGWPSANP